MNVVKFNQNEQFLEEEGLRIIEELQEIIKRIEKGELKSYAYVYTDKESKMFTGWSGIDSYEIGHAVNVLQHSYYNKYLGR